MSANQFMEMLFGKLPEFFKDEDELRALWSAPDTRKRLLNGLAEKGFGHEQLVEMQKIIDAESASENGKAAASESVEQSAVDVSGREETPILERMGYDRATGALIEAESWAGPAKLKQSPRNGESKLKIERESFVDAARVKPQVARAFQRMA